MKKRLARKEAPDMSKVMDIVTDYITLSDRCDEIDVRKAAGSVQSTVIKLKNTIRANEGMLGLSANQIGCDGRIICLNFNGKIKSYVNPIVTNAKGIRLTRESCHSLPGRQFIRVRSDIVDVTYQTPLGKIESTTLYGVAATIMQHHIDHLDGLLLEDVGLEIFDDFDTATDEEREEVIKMYLDSLDMRAEELANEVENDPDGKQLTQAIKFMESVKKGETIVEQVPLSDEEFEKLKEDTRKKIEEHNAKVIKDRENEDA